MFFSQECVKIKSSKQKFIIDALHPDFWNGVIFKFPADIVFGFRIGTYAYHDNKVIYINGGKAFYNKVKKVGGHAPEGLYNSLFWESIEGVVWHFRWRKIRNDTVIGTIELESGKETQGGIIIEFLSPWDYQTIYFIDKGFVKGKTAQIEQAGFCFSSNIIPDRAVSFTNQEELEKDVHTDGIITQGSQGNNIAIQYDKIKKLSFVVRCGEDALTVKDNYFIQNDIEKLLKEGKDEYVNKRVKADGMFSGAGESITNHLGWMTLLIPHTNITYVPAGRTWAWKGWNLFEWDSFFNALLLSVENMNMAFNELEGVFSTQYSDGNMPNYKGENGGTRDRSQPPVGAFALWKIYLKSGKVKALLEKYYPQLTKWYSWWMDKSLTGKPRRDGNEDGFLEWGSDEKNLQFAKYESGMDDSPLWDNVKMRDETGTMDLNALDLNCLRAVDAECLSKMARELGYEQDYETYKNEYTKIKEMINEKMWDDKEGFYYDLYWNGKLSNKKAASSFYPLIAGIASEERASLIVRHMVNDREFWGEYILPTISRDDSSFSDQQYWRGTIWPPSNYLVYQGLKRYGYDELSGEFSKKSAKMFLNNYFKDGSCRENYNSMTGEGGGEKFQSWGPLLALIAIEEIIDIEPWSEGLRFGSVGILENVTLKNIKIAGKLYNITAGNFTVLEEDGTEVFRANGRCVVREFNYINDKLTFEIKNLDELELSIILKKVQFEKRVMLLIDGKEKDLIPQNGKVLFSIDPGVHLIALSWFIH